MKDSMLLTDRQVLRRQLLKQRIDFSLTDRFASAQTLLAQHVLSTLEHLEPSNLGTYWAIRGEFDLLSALQSWLLFQSGDKPQLALPKSHKEPLSLRYHFWQPDARQQLDDWDIPCGQGAETVPDVILVPCVGFTAQGHRLGYGAGFFDRWLSLHPHVTAIGIAWSGSVMSEEVFAAQAHDQPLMLVITELGVAAP
jgi:5-formyltetrahydrofolate cyclo-ligase